MRVPGIRTLDDVRDRCIVDEESGCWIWRGARSKGRYPQAWFPLLGRATTIGRILLHLIENRAPKPREVWHSKCGHPDCCAPAHRRSGNRRSQMRAAKIERNAITRARIAASRRARSKLSDEQAQIIRESPDTLRELAARYGISKSWASCIKRGQGRSVIPRASVFSVANPRRGRKR
jgi:hypothetical protein